MEEKKTHAMNELRLYMMNTESIYKAYMTIVRDIVAREDKTISDIDKKKMHDIAFLSIRMYRRDIGPLLATLTFAQMEAVADEILQDEVNDAIEYLSRCE